MKLSEDSNQSLAHNGWKFYDEVFFLLEIINFEIELVVG